jgi:hypothetical protein
MHDAGLYGSISLQIAINRHLRRISLPWPLSAARGSFRRRRFLNTYQRDRLHHFVHRGPRRWARSMWFASLRNKYREEYRLLKAEWDGELYEQ